MQATDLSRSAFLGTVPLLGIAAATATASAQTSPVIRVGAVPVDGFAEAYYARDMGFFERAGLNVEITTFNNGSGATTAAAGGAIDIGISTVNSIANAVIHGIPYVYIAGGSMYVASAPSAVLAIAKDSTIKTPADLIGKTVAISAFKDGTHLAMAAYLTKNGIDPAKVNFIEMQYPLMAPAVVRGTVAAAVLVEPFVTFAANDVHVFAKPLDALSTEFLLAGWFTTTTWLEANRPLARKFVAAMYETARWANANHAKSGELLQKYSKVDDATVAHMARSVYADRLDAAQLDPTLDWSARVNFTERRVTAKELIARV
jgi:NitT/TauT family transport system substrate-binding protein